MKKYDYIVYLTPEEVVGRLKNGEKLYKILESRNVFFRLVDGMLIEFNGKKPIKYNASFDETDCCFFIVDEKKEKEK